MTQREFVRPLNIGLWSEGPLLERPPGALAVCRNYEIQPSGCERVPGYERFDGRPSPSDAVWYSVPYSGLTADIFTGQILEVPFNGIYRSVLALQDVSYLTAPSGTVALGYLDTIPEGEEPDRPDSTGEIRNGGSEIAAIGGVALKGAAPDDETEKTWRRTLESHLRSNIQTVPGTGSVLMAAAVKGVVVAARAANATNADLHVSSATGWQTITPGRTLNFTSGGTYQIQPSDTITGATSGATATVVAVILQSGSWSAGDAAGYLVLSGQSGTFQSENLNVGGNADVATISGDSTAITFSANAPWFWDVGAVKAGTTESLFFTDTVGLFEFDGTNVIPLRTGTTGTPRHVAVHKNHVFVSYDYSVVHSALGDARDWRSASGASEIATDGRVTALQPYAKVLVIGTDRSVNLLHGTSSADWSFEVLSRSSGVFENTMAVAGQPVYLDRGGIRLLETTAAFGDFSVSTLSPHAHRVVLSWITRNADIVGAIVNRSRAVYRLVLDDGKVLSMYFGSERAAFAILDYGLQVSCAWSGQSGGHDFHLLGGQDGYVYILDKGRNFDGNDIDATIRTVWDHGRSRTRMKRYMRLVLDVEVTKATFTVTPLFDYGSEPSKIGSDLDETLEGSGAVWGGFVWGEAVWGQPEFPGGVLMLDGRGYAIGLLVTSKSADELPHTLRSYTVRYAERRLV